jgi:hypothetical protein
MIRYGALVIAFLFPATAAAQADTSGRGEVVGTVYDSVARSPVRGATVQLVSVASPEQHAYSAITDAKGDFTISGVAAGRFVIGFQHEALDTLALNTPMRVVDVRAGERTRADVSVPAPAQIVAALCHSNPADSTGLIVGMLRDARGRDLLTSGSVLARWSDLIIDSSGLSRYERVTQAAVGIEGWFTLCNVPAMPDLALFGIHENDTTGATFVTVPANGIIRRDLFLHGTAIVRGTVRSERNVPISNARIGFIGRERTVATDSAGVFFMGDAAAGSQTLEVRALGYAPAQQPILLPAGADTTLNVSLTSVKRVLDTIQVVARRLFNRDSYGFERRKRLGGGYFFDEASVNAIRPFDLLQLLQRVPGLYVTRHGLDRQVLMRGGFHGNCNPTFYLNGMRMPKDVLPDLDLYASPQELAGMEVYRSTTAPAQFTDFSGCGSVVVWTRPPRRKQ